MISNPNVPAAMTGQSANLQLDTHAVSTHLSESPAENQSSDTGKDSCVPVASSLKLLKHSEHKHTRLK